MIPVYICEDLEDELQALIKIVEGTIKYYDLKGIEIVCATSNPDEVLDKTAAVMHPGIYYLDIDLGEGIMNGIDLGAKLHAVDPSAYIVMVTTHAEAAPLTFKYKIGARDYILKDDRKEMELRIRDSLIDGFHSLGSLKERKIIHLSTGIKYFSVFEDQINYVELLPKTKNKLYISYDEVSEIAISPLHEFKNQLGDSFYQCNKSTIINMNSVVEINYKDRFVKMQGGKEIPISIRCLPCIKKRYLQFDQSFSEFHD